MENGYRVKWFMRFGSEKQKLTGLECSLDEIRGLAKIALRNVAKEEGAEMEIEFRDEKDGWTTAARFKRRDYGFDINIYGCNALVKTTVELVEMASCFWRKSV